MILEKLLKIVQVVKHFYTWLSCEEYDQGMVWECDPFQKQLPRPYPKWVYFHMNLLL